MAFEIAIDELGTTAATNTGLVGITSGMKYHRLLTKAINYLMALRNGSYQMGPTNGIYVKMGATFGYWEGTFTGVPTAADTITINGTAITCQNSGAGNNEFNKGASASAAAANLAAAINASTTAAVSKCGYATSSAGVVRYTCRHPGVISGLLTVTESMNNFTITTSVATGIGTDNTNVHITYP